MNIGFSARSITCNRVKRFSGFLATELPSALDITKTYIYNFDPLKSHFYIVKLGFKRLYIIFLISARRGGSNEYPQTMF